MGEKMGKILICDDSILVRKKLKDMLLKIGCSVVEAANGKEVIAMYQQEHPDIVFMDIVMPELDGLEALRQIKAFDGNAKVIMVSSVGTSEKLIQALKSGAIDFLQKPYTAEQIQDIIDKNIK